jgi:hypothetical protein
MEMQGWGVPICGACNVRHQGPGMLERPKTSLSNPIFAGANRNFAKPLRHVGYFKRNHPMTGHIGGDDERFFILKFKQK